MRIILGWFILLASFGVGAQPTPVELSVWANEAIVATYTYDYQHYIEEQKFIAHYFTTSGWMSYSQALIKSELPKRVQTNHYYVSAVAVSPPKTTSLSAGLWKIQMPLLVEYRNPQRVQKQTLLVTIYVKALEAGQGVRGFAIERLQSIVQKPVCACDLAPG